MHNSWTSTLDSFKKSVKDEKKKDAVLKKTVKKLLYMGKEESPPIDFEKYTPKHFNKYLLSLRSDKNKILSIASYAMKRSSLFHLFRLYGVKLSKDFDSDMIVLYKCFKRKVAEEVQQRGGKIETGKSPMTYGLYRQLNIYFLEKKTVASFWARAFLNLTWTLMCRATNTFTIHLHHLVWCDDCLIYTNSIDPSV